VADLPRMEAIRHSKVICSVQDARFNFFR